MASVSNLVIVESPSKAKTISKYLGPDYTVKASMGHLRDLPKSTMGVDLEHDFTPKYLPVSGKEELIKELEILSIKKEIALKNFQIKYDAKEAEADDLKNENEILKQQIAFYKKMVHGQKTEKTEVVLKQPEQLSLFDEAETEATGAHPEKEIL